MSDISGLRGASKFGQVFTSLSPMNKFDRELSQNCQYVVSIDSYDDVDTGNHNRFSIKVITTV